MATVSMFGTRELTDEQTSIRRQFLDFFDSDAFREKYDGRLRRMMSEAKNRVLLDTADLLDFVPADMTQGALGKGVIRAPGKYLPLCELAVHDLVLARQPDYLKVDYRSRPVHVGLEGPVGEIVGPRELYARHLNTIVAVEGIVTRQSPMRPRVLETVHYCADTNKFSRKEYRDQLSPMLDAAHLPTVNVMPKTDMEGHLLRTELGLCSFLDGQCAVLQEAPERAPTGQLPRSVEIRFDDDLVDSVKPGDRVVIVGTYAPYTTADTRAFQTILLANHVHQAQIASKVPRLLESTATALRRFAADQIARGGPTRLLELLGRSIAPSLYGLTFEKQAILLLLIGGVERAAHHSHIRGDINVLLVGEPSTAKSQLLRYVINLAPLALSTTGKGSSGVGLTAAVTSDPYTGERSLSAGAMVLADRGILCVDEFDKMSSQDRVAMHEAMEQQTVTVAKAGINATLNARCSVLAAANPVFGVYSTKHKLSFNVGLPESLLSRFDLVFIILDKHDSEHNRRIGNHILQNHMTAAPAPFAAVEVKTVVGSALERGGAAAQLEQENVSPFLTTANTASAATSATGDSGASQCVTVDFLRRYLLLAKSMSPMLNADSQRLVSEHYVALRAEQKPGGAGSANATKDGFIITPRTLEAILRLATAHAKLRLSETIDACDVDVAMQLMRASVHAAGDAASQREAEKTARPEEDGSPADHVQSRGPRVESVTPSDSSAAVATSSSALASSAARRQAPAVGAAAGDAVKVSEVVRSLMREHRAQATMQDVAERLTTLGLALSAPAALPGLLRSMSNDGSAAFTFSEQEGAIFFH